MDESEVVARVWVFFAAFFCGVLAHFAALCILVFMPLQRSQLSLSLWLDMLMSQELSPGFRVFLQPFLVAFFVHLEGDPFTTFVLRYGLAWCCYWVTDRHSLFAGGWHSRKKQKSLRDTIFDYIVYFGPLGKYL